jgi:ribosomal protein S6
MSTTEGQTERTVYEIGYLVLPSIPEDSLDPLASTINKSFEKLGGERLDGEAPFMIDLAYEMSKTVGARKYVVREAYLGWVKFELEADKIEEVKKEIEAMPEILRILVIKAPRETTFTFEAARQALREAEEAKNAPVEPIEGEPEAPAETVVL